VQSIFLPLLVLSAVLAGAAIALQAAINAQLRTWLVTPLAAALASFVVGGVALAVALLAVDLPRLRAGGLGLGPWWVWTGGVLGAFYIVTSIVAAPRLGPALFFGVVVAGQMLTALVLEHYGLLGLARHPLSVGRVAGVVLLVLGVALIRRF
jgi:transporter family-2 protein